MSKHNISTLKQTTPYTIIYIIVMVLIVGIALAATALALKPRQQENINADKMKQILAAVHIVPEKGQVSNDFKHYITEQIVVNSEGELVDDDAFTINMAEQVKLADSERKLPMFVCRLDNGEQKYIIPAYGAGLWGPIWGYIAIDSDGSTIYGAYFAHQGETPGLGAEIEKPVFTSQFNSSLHLFKDGNFLPIEVVKGGKAPANGADYVNGISGGTITSKGVGSMLNNCLSPYKSYLEQLSKK